MKPGNKNSYNSLKKISIDGNDFKYYSLSEAEKNGLNGVSKLPKSLKVLLENLLRYEDDLSVTKSQIEAIKNWLKTKIVFPDISEKPIFTLDNSGAIVSGECYWLLLNETEDTDLNYLILGIANSKFIEKFYDISFPNKLYSGKRRFITQYVEKFPLPDACSRHSKEIIAKVKTILSVSDKLEFEAIEEEINVLVEKAFGLLN